MPTHSSQRVYNSSDIAKLRELFGADSVEYGMGVSGHPNLPNWLRHGHQPMFSAEDVKLRLEDTKQNAERVLEIRKLIGKLEEGLIGTAKDDQPWFKEKD